MLNDTMNKISRLIYILNELDKGQIFLPRIAEDPGVTLRTIQRDLHILEDARFPITNIKKGTYCFIEGFSPGRASITAREAAMFALIADIAYTLGGPFGYTYKLLHDKIIGQQQNPYFVKVTQGQTFKDQNLVKILEKAINNQNHVVIEYENSRLSG